VSLPEGETIEEGLSQWEVVMTDLAQGVGDGEERLSRRKELMKGLSRRASEW